MYSHEKTIYVKSVSGDLPEGLIRVFDLLGREVGRKELRRDPVISLALQVNSGYYVATVTTAEGVTSRKVFIN